MAVTLCDGGAPDHMHATDRHFIATSVLSTNYSTVTQDRGGLGELRVTECSVNIFCQLELFLQVTNQQVTL